ncbi:MAG: hypothetical protein Q7S69_05370 [Nitrosomonadaceae bacterium]|nr:hypothetical protein [Nitrosomonadaceae bacterium]
MSRISLLAVLLLASSSALCGQLIFPPPGPNKVIVCEPNDPKKEVVYIDPMALPLSDTDPLGKYFDNGVCAGYEEKAWEMYVTNYWRKSEIKVGTKTDKGLVIEVKLPVVRVQTKGDVQWFRVDDLSPEIKKPTWLRQ